MRLDLSKIPEFLKPVKDPLITYEDSLKICPAASAAHILIWSKSTIPGKRANVMMHLRFDGLLGFPGGLIDPGEDAVKAINRELVEEIGWSKSKNKVTWDDYVWTRRDMTKNYILHFFIKELSTSDYVDLEKRCIGAPEYGYEVLGTIRVPLYIGMAEHAYGMMGHKHQALSSFLQHKFVSDCQVQLLLGLYHLQLHSVEALKFLVETMNRNRS